jgi:hypothetical protein
MREIAISRFITLFPRALQNQNDGNLSGPIPINQFDILSKLI